jgi:eukaryotic-like serine/threonine-protein kinase
MTGTILANRYRMGERIGGGGMSLVFRARDLQLDRDVAVKVLRGQFGQDEEFVRRFKREAQNAASLSHPNVVQIYDVGMDQDQYFIVMELVEGQTLKALIQSQGPLPIAEATRISSEILSALAHAHANRIVHRDIKPHNILIARDGRVKVADFGIARATTTDTVTHTGSIMGSAHYFSPEQANGQPTGEKSDIYSAGIVLYEMITGTVPFQGDSPITVALKHIREQVVPPSRLNAEVPAELDEIVLQALEKDPEDRYRSADALREALEQFAEDHAAGRTHMPSGDFPTMDLRGMRGRSRLRRTLDEEEDDEEEGPRKPSRAWIWVTAIALVVVGLISFGVWSLVRFMDVPVVTMPDVVGMPQIQAQEELKKLKLAPYTASYQYSNDVPKLYVIKTDPPAHTPIKQGRDIALTISQGPDLKALPEVRNRSLDDARATLETQKFTVDPDITYKTSPVAEGQVIEMTPPAGTPAAPGTIVKLVVSQGPLKVPEISGLTLAQAQAKLLAAGLAVGTKDYVANPTKPRDTVLSSTPVQGTAVAPNSVVNLTLSAGQSTAGTPFEKEITVPGVAGTVHDVRIDLVDMVTGVPTTTILKMGKFQVGEKLTVSGSFMGQASLKVYVDGQQTNSIPLP